MTTSPRGLPRPIVGLLILSTAVAGCDNAKERGRAAARAEAEAARKAEVEQGLVAPKISPPVAGGRKLNCGALIDAAKFAAALGEKFPIEVRDISSTDAEASGACALVRGGKRPTTKEQDALLKKNGGRLGVIPGEVICNVSAYCWTLESEESVRKWCERNRYREDDSPGGPACLRVVAHGADDVHSFRFWDSDSKCALNVNGGPRQNNNEQILACAKVARDSIGPTNIAVDAPNLSAAPAAPPPAAP